MYVSVHVRNVRWTGVVGAIYAVQYTRVSFMIPFPSYLQSLVPASFTLRPSSSDPSRPLDCRLHCVGSRPSRSARLDSTPLSSSSHPAFQSTRVLAKQPSSSQVATSGRALYTAPSRQLSRHSAAFLPFLFIDHVQNNPRPSPIPPWKLHNANERPDGYIILTSQHMHRVGRARLKGKT